MTGSDYQISGVKLIFCFTLVVVLLLQLQDSIKCYVLHSPLKNWKFRLSIYNLSVDYYGQHFRFSSFVVQVVSDHTYKSDTWAPLRSSVATVLYWMHFGVQANSYTELALSICVKFFNLNVVFIMKRTIRKLYWLLDIKYTSIYYIYYWIWNCQNNIIIYLFLKMVYEKYHFQT